MSVQTVILILPLFFLFPLTFCQKETLSSDALTIPEELDEGTEEKPFEKEILVIPNRFPKELNFFCYPRSGLQQDRLCFGQLDAYALACADDTPPLQLVPFCLAFKGKCSKVNYPAESWCKKEKKQYKRFCTLNKRQSCKSCHYDLGCSCEPYECIWRRFGFETARWCQRYELFCNQKARREKASELVTLMQDTVKVHYRCFHMFNLAEVICDPFRRQFDHERCMKFLFDCELISDFEEEEKKPDGGKPETGRIEGFGGVDVGSKKAWASPEEAKQAKKLQEEEEMLAKQIAAAETGAKPTSNSSAPHPFEKIQLKPEVVLPEPKVDAKFEEGGKRPKVDVEASATYNEADPADVVAKWSVPLQDKIHKIEFEHGTTTGKRVVRVDGKEIIRREWMFKLVGKETFTIGNKVKCVISVDSVSTFSYEYTLDVNGKTFDKFREEQGKRLQCWEIHVGGEDVRVVLDKESMEVWVNGSKIHTAGEFVEDGTETHFECMGHPCKIRSVSSGRKKVGIVHTLYLDGRLQASEVSHVVDYRAQ